MDHLSDAMREFRKKHLRLVDGSMALNPTEKPVVYACGICKDTGYLRADVQPGHPQFGKPIPCVCTQDRVKERLQQDLLEISGIVGFKRFKDATFESYNQRIAGTRIAFDAARSFAVNPNGWLVLVGPCGCGKTHLTVSIAKELLLAKYTVLMHTVPDLLDSLRDGFNPQVEASFNDRFEQMKDAECLFLDDYGAENTTSWGNEKLFQLLNYRYNRELPTVITSNGLDKIDSRIKSRLNDAGLVNMIEMDKATDYRPRMQRTVDGSQEQ